jgi:hypothetical protein
MPDLGSQDHINLEPHHSLVKELLVAGHKSFGFEAGDEIPPNAGESADNCRRRTHSSSLGTFQLSCFQIRVTGSRPATFQARAG